MAVTELPRFMIEATKNLADKVAAERGCDRLAAIAAMLSEYGLLVGWSDLQKQTIIRETHDSVQDESRHGLLLDTEDIQIQQLISGICDEDTHDEWRRLNEETE